MVYHAQIHNQLIMIRVGDRYIVEFDNNFVSPFYLDGMTWISSEQYYQAAKFDDLNHVTYINRLTDPNEIYVQGHSTVYRTKPQWQDHRYEMMRSALWCKFDQNPHLAALLKDTGTAEIVYESRDSYWGDPGENMLGRVLMDVRALL